MVEYSVAYWAELLVGVWVVEKVVEMADSMAFSKAVRMVKRRAPYWVA